MCVRLGGMCMGCMGSGWSPWPHSCSVWLSWTGWLPQFSSARTPQLFFRLWCLPSYNGWSFNWTWIALSLLGSPHLTTCLCSLSLTFSVLSASPTGTSEWSLQRILSPQSLCVQLLSLYKNMSTRSFFSFGLMPTQSNRNTRQWHGYIRPISMSCSSGPFSYILIILLWFACLFNCHS